MRKFFILPSLLLGIGLMLGVNMCHAVGQDFIVSPYESVLGLERQTAPANGESVVLLRGVIRDANKNELPNLPIQVLSERGGIDRIVSQLKTDNLGQFTARISSQVPGSTSFTVVANDTAIFFRPVITFYTDSTTANVGSGGFGQFLQASLFGNTSKAQTEYFVLEDLSSPLVINDSFSVKITAKDASGNKDPDYRGTIRFVVPSDPNAKLPADYTFTEEDQGEHSFYLAVSFGTIGKHKLAIKDISDIRISGEMDIDVIPKPGSGGGVTVGYQGTENLTTGKIDIQVPSNGSKFSASRITLSGVAPGVQNLQLFDGPTLVSNNIPVNADGTFAYQTPQLADGLHQFQFFSSGGENEFKSDKINVTIDQTPPTVLKVDLVPSNEAQPQEEVTVLVGSTEDLSEVEGVFLGVPMVFERMDERTFRAFITAPDNGGAYPISVSAADLLGNTKNEPNAEVLYVKLPQVLTPPVQAAEIPVVAERKYESLNVEPYIEISVPKNLVPTAVTNLSAVPGENKVTLFWSPATDDIGIKYYEIRYGDDLLQVNKTPDNRTQWYIDGLVACEKVKFSVTPIDLEGEAGQTSNIIESSAKCYRQNMTTPPKSGASSWLSMIFSMIFGGFLVLLLRRMSR